MPRPGTDVVIVDEQVPGGPSLDSGQAFFAGVAERGPTDRALKITGTKAFRNYYGERSGGSLLYDAVGAFFNEGGETLYVSRVAAADAAAATIPFGTTLTANADSPGAWGNRVSIRALAPATLSEQLQAQRLEGTPRAGTGVVLVVALDDVDVERSSVVATRDEAVEWASSSYYVDLALLGVTEGLPAAGTTVDLAGGADGAAAPTDISTALSRFEHALGPGQVAAPGYTSSAAHDALLAHADALSRVVLLDLPDDPDPLVISAAVTRLYAIEGARFAGAFGPWAECRGPASPSTVLVPYSGVQAGMLARVDGLGNPNQPAAGTSGVSRSALGLSQVYDDDERQSLNAVGATLAKPVYGDVRTYGGRTVAGPDDALWQWLGGSRTVMAISYEAGAIAENYVLRQIDGRGQLFAAFESDLRGMLLRFYTVGALYGDTPEDAFYVDTSSAVNTVETIEAGEVHAVIYVKTSPSAEYVRVDIVKVPLERALPSAA
jgi:hypothetical protein